MSNSNDDVMQDRNNNSNSASGHHPHHFRWSFSDRMHPRNPYLHKPLNLKHLAVEFPNGLGAFVKGDGSYQIDWNDAAALRQLTATLLLRDFGLHWTIPDNRLVPPLPNRLNYICWVQDLLSEAIILKAMSPSDPIRGIDVGTGANCIFPLLGIKFAGWSHFLATDVDGESLQAAHANLAINGLDEQRVQLVHVPNIERGIGPLKAALRGQPPAACYHFSMCNPPFFETEQQAMAGVLSHKQSPPKALYPKAMTEVVTAGGEEAFVSAMIEDSVALGDRILWFTSMIGRRANLKALITKAKMAGASVVKTTQFFQGHTVRWGIAWTFCKAMLIARTEGDQHKIVEQDYVLTDLGCTKDELAARMVAFFQERGATDIHVDNDGVEKNEMKWSVTVAVPNAAVPLNLHVIISTADSKSGQSLSPSPSSSAAATTLMVDNDPNIKIELEADHLEGYVAAEFHKICDQMPGEITRSNRKWRRWQQRQQQQQQQGHF